MKHDPLYLFENKPEKFKKFLRKRMGGEEVAVTPSEKQTEEPKKVIPPQPALNKAVSAPVQKAKIEMADLISLSSSETFQDFQSAPEPSNNFTEFQSAPTTSNFDSLLNLYNNNPSQAQSGPVKTGFQPNMQSFG